MSDRKRITCPETGHLEEVELERTPLGLLVTGCSRFGAGPVACPRECARRMDRRDRADEDLRERVLILVANLHDDAARIASSIAAQLAAEGMTAELASLELGHVPPLADYDAVVIGARVRLGQHDRALTTYIREHLAELRTLPAFWYCVGQGSFPSEAVARLTARRTGWQPTATWSFVDASDSQRDEVRGFAELIADEVPALVEP
ncbi:MAG: hypothetical protein JO257_36900 [Deltaproteobacteria bacterium]|nr:hypothetical protein [Deltaproteobacteria bacterium]